MCESLENLAEQADQRAAHQLPGCSVLSWVSLCKLVLKEGASVVVSRGE